MLRRFVRYPITLSPLRLVLTLALLAFVDLKDSREEIWLQEKYPDNSSYKRQAEERIPWIY